MVPHKHPDPILRAIETLGKPVQIIGAHQSGGHQCRSCCLLDLVPLASFRLQSWHFLPKVRRPGQFCQALPIGTGHSHQQLLEKRVAGSPARLQRLRLTALRPVSHVPSASPSPLVASAGPLRSGGRGPPPPHWLAASKHLWRGLLSGRRRWLLPLL